MSRAEKVILQGTSLEVEGNALLEGYPLIAISRAFSEEPLGTDVLSYDDVIRFFSLSTDVYTPEDHQLLSMRMINDAGRDIWLRDALPDNFGSRIFLSLDNLSPWTLCELRMTGLSTIEHLAKAKNGKPYVIKVAMDRQELEKFGLSLPSIPFALDIPGVVREEKEVDSTVVSVIAIPSKKAMECINPIHGDITTDIIGEGGVYDMAVMMNTFMYFDERERLLAMDNIGRLLKPGGVFVTDVPNRGIAPHKVCENLPDHGMHPSIYPATYEDSSPSIDHSLFATEKPVVFWKKLPF